MHHIQKITIKKAGISFLFIVLLPLLSGAQNLLPPIHNYEIFEYNAAGQNWGLAVNEEGELFAANNKGLLYFNGAQWTLHKLPNNTIIRSVAVVENKIYTGSYEEFGYWMKNEKGELHYTSLTPLIKDHVFTSEEFWQILPYGEKIIFRSFSTLYIYQDNHITVVNPKVIVTAMAVYDDKFIVAGDNNGLFQLTADHTFLPLNDRELLKDKTVIDMVAIPEGLLAGTRLNGCYLYKDNRLIPWEEPPLTPLKLYQLNRMVPVTPHKIAFGTIKNGIYLYDTQTQTLEQFNKSTGLQNNTVLALTRYREQLWVGLDNGIDRIQLNAPIRYYTDRTGTLGTVYDLAVKDGILYLGSNTGVYYIEDNELHFVPGSQGHIWDLEVINGKLCCGHNTGTFIVDKKKFEKVSGFAGGYQFAKVPERQNLFLQGIYTGMARYAVHEKDRWEISRIAGINFPVKQLCFENETTLWAAHPYKGCYRIKMYRSFDSIAQLREFGTDAMPGNYNIKLHRIKNQIVLYSGGNWYQYDPIADEIVPFKAFETFTRKELIYHNESHFWFIDNERSKEIHYTDLKGEDLVIADMQLKRRLVPDAENVVRWNDSLYYITLSDGFSEINLARLYRQLENFSVPAPRLNFFKDEKKLYPLDREVLEIPYKDARNITLQVSSPALVQPRYYYELKGPETRSAYTEEGNIHFRNLPHGRYQLHVSTVNIDNKKSALKKISFVIAPPWYLSRLSILFYFLIFLGLILAVRKYNRYKLEKQHTQLRQQLHKEQEKKLAAMEKERLSGEIRQKQKELASTTMNMARKNQVILEMKSLLLVNRDKFSNQQRYRALLKKLDTSMKHTDEWKQFEMSFRELHEDFFENLLRRFPHLTPKDLKLCAYLKMNLSSKEIAPLMGITLRGVEIHRYRLRKKLDLDTPQNLSNFLITFT